jgi:hypothetical protein
VIHTHDEYFLWEKKREGQLVFHTCKEQKINDEVYVYDGKKVAVNLPVVSFESNHIYVFHLFRIYFKKINKKKYN